MANTPLPTFLADFAETYRTNPREATRRWLKKAKFGLFLHYGLYSLIGRHEWVQYREQIRPAAYATLADWFLADKFDAEFICQLAVDAGMQYVNLTTRHHDSFCLWDTKQTTFNVMHTPCGRDLVGELAAACEKHGLGLCLYYSHGRDWKHPHAANNEQYGGAARPQYDPPELTYASGPGHDLNHYLEFMKRQIEELLTSYGPIAAIWLDGIGVLKHGDAAAFKCEELYELIWSKQPQVLVSYKDGMTGTEDFFSPEEGWKFDPAEATKPWEVCAHLTGGWGYTAGTRHRETDEIWQLMGNTIGRGGNLLLNTGPLPDGSIEPDSIRVLREIGERVQSEGWPSPAEA